MCPSPGEQESLFGVTGSRLLWLYLHELTLSQGHFYVEGAQDAFRVRRVAMESGSCLWKVWGDL